MHKCAYNMHIWQHWTVVLNMDMNKGSRRDINITVNFPRKRNRTRKIHLPWKYGIEETVRSDRIICIRAIELFVFELFVYDLRVCLHIELVSNFWTDTKQKSYIVHFLGSINQHVLGPYFQEAINRFQFWNIKFNGATHFVCSLSFSTTKLHFSKWVKIFFSIWHLTIMFFLFHIWLLYNHFYYADKFKVLSCCLWKLKL